MYALLDAQIRNHAYVIGANKLTELCSNLFRYTPITFFEPFKIYKNNEYSGLMTDGKWAEEFLKKGYHNSGIAKFQEVHLQCDYTLWSISAMFDISDDAQKMRQDCIDFNYGNGITLIERYEEYTQLYYFGASSTNINVNEFFINNMELLNNFILYFNEQCHKDKFLMTAYSTKYICKNEIENNIQISQNNLSELSQQLISNIKKIYLHGLEKNLYVTISEYKCLQLTIQGNSTKKIAKALNLSHRTVESHLNNLRKKTGCINKYDLVRKFYYKGKFFKIIT